MICESIIGNLRDDDFSGYYVDYVDIEWHETFKKLHKKQSHEGEEVGIRLGNDVLKYGVRQGDILYKDDQKVVAIHIPACECIVVDVDEHHQHMLGKVCYEVGNKHASLFWGESYRQVITPYNEPTFKLLQALHGVQVRRKMVQLDLDRGISAVVHNHTH